MAFRVSGSRNLVGALLALWWSSGCAGVPYGSAPAPQDGPAPGPAPAPSAPPSAAASARSPSVGIGDASVAFYRQGGLLVQPNAVLPFVGSVHYFASPVDDSTLVLVSLSLANRALIFAPDGSTEKATFDVAVVVRDSVNPVVSTEDQQVVRVGTFKETSRADESVVYERYVTVRPGRFTLSVTVTDRGSANSTAAQIALVVPRLGARTLSSPTTVNHAIARTRRDTLPDLIVNPRSTLIFGRDSVAPIYLEAYGLPAGSRIALTVLSADHDPLIRDTVTLTRAQSIAAAEFDLSIARIGLGRRMVIASVVGSTDTASSPLWVTVGEGMGLISFEEMLSYLRYFATAERLQALREAPPAQRAAVWAAFWKETDPNPATAENEALRDYFERIQVANQRFREQGEPGWLTDRGKVFITLGEPDQITGQDGRGLTTSGRSQYWAYVKLGIRFELVDQNGMGRWRLTPRAESDFEQIAQRERVH
jgi:GWxTD domain-containing protein